MNIRPLFDPRTSTLTYVVWDETTRDAVIIDPVLDFDAASGRIWEESVDRVAALVDLEGLRVRAILETHAHADHLSGSQALAARYGAPVVIGDAITRVQEVFAPVFDMGPGFRTDGSQFDRLLRDGEVLDAGALRIEAIHTPGHTPACTSYHVGDAVFTGDALFMPDYGTGRCDFPAGSADALYDSVQRLYRRLPPSTRVFVGHDYQPGGREVRWESTIGEEMEKNVQLRASTSRDEFVAFREARDAKLDAPKLLYPSVQVNIDAGRLPPAGPNGRRYLKIPLRVPS